MIMKKIGRREKGARPKFYYVDPPLIHPSTLAVCYEPTWRIFEVRYNGRLWEIDIFLRLTLYKLQKS